jgi:hypothetical protein
MTFVNLWFSNSFCLGDHAGQAAAVVHFRRSLKALSLRTAGRILR